MWLELLKGLPVFLDHRLRDGLQPLQIGVRHLRLSQRPGSIPLSHIDGAVHQVTKVVGEVRVIARDQPCFAEVSVLTCDDVAHEVIAERVGSVFLGEEQRVNDIAKAFAHLRPAHIPPAMHE